MTRLYSHPFTRARELLAEDDAARETKLARETREADRLRRNAGELKNVGINSGSDLLLKKSKQLRDRAAALEQTLRPAPERSGDIRLANRGTHAKVHAGAGTVSTSRSGWADAVPHRQAGRLPAGSHRGARPQRRWQVATGAAVAPALSGGDVPGIRASPSIVMGYVDQLMSHLPDAMTPHGFISDRFRPGDQRTVSLLAGAGFNVDMQRRRSHVCHRDRRRGSGCWRCG